MLKKILVTLSLPVLLAGCSSQPVKPEHFGGDERVQSALANPDLPILIAEFGTSDPNSAGGVDVRVEFINTSDKAIKYVVFSLTPYNKVLDPVEDRIGRGSTRKVHSTGPYNPEQSNTFRQSIGQPKSGGMWRNTWYNHGIYCATIDKVEIEYMDGTITRITDTDALLTRPGTCRSYPR